MIVVADAGPLIHLSLVGQLDLLRLLYGRVLVPTEVYEEVVSAADLPGSHELRGADWAEIVPADPAHALFQRLRARLDPGEAAALSLGIARQADLILSDDREARHAARDLNLQVKGTLGVLVEAKQRGLCAAVTPLLLDLRAKGTWISADLLEKVIQSVGESSLQGE